MVVTTEPTSTPGPTDDRGPGDEAGLSPEAAARSVALLFPEVYRRYHYARRPAGDVGLPVTRRGLEVLMHLASGGPLTIGEQAEHLGLRRNTTSELVGRLEAKGLVSRIRDERDERRVLVWLTDAGRDVVGRVGQVLAPDLLTLVMTELDPRDRATVVRGLQLLAGAPEPNEMPAEGGRGPIQEMPADGGRGPTKAAARSRRATT
jgi:DNA-binding MarR family transcriptional regulator